MLGANVLEAKGRTKPMASSPWTNGDATLVAQRSHGEDAVGFGGAALMDD
jgi:hypothetical protein